MNVFTNRAQPNEKESVIEISQSEGQAKQSWRPMQSTGIV